MGLRFVPRVIITDKLKSYGAAKAEVMPSVEHRRQKYQNSGFWTGLPWMESGAWTKNSTAHKPGKLSWCKNRWYKINA